MTIHLLIGNIGTGKSTTALKIFHENTNTVSINVDDLCYMFNMGEYKDQYWTENYKTLYLTSVWGLLEQALMLGFNVILDGTNMSAQKRKNIFGFAGLYEAEVVGYLHSNHKEGLKRRKIDNRDQPDEMWEKVYENFQSQYDEPTLDEGFTEIKIIN